MRSKISTASRSCSQSTRPVRRRSSILGNVSCDVDRKNDVTVDDGVGGSDPWMGDVCGWL